MRWTEHAFSDALGIYDYIADQSPRYAEAVFEQILARPSQLVDHPESGSIVPEYNRGDLRQVFVHSFRLIYRIADGELRVLTVIHGSRVLPPEVPEID